MSNLERFKKRPFLDRNILLELYKLLLYRNMQVICACLKMKQILLFFVLEKSQNIKNRYVNIKQ